MFKVYLDGEILQDAYNFLIDPKLELAESTAGSFTFGMYPDHPLYDELGPKKKIKIIQIIPDGTERWIWSGRLSEPSEDFDLKRTFECEGILAYLADSIQRPAEYHNISVISFLTTLLSIHNEQVDDYKKIKLGVVTVTDPNDSLYRYTNYEDTLTVIKEKLVDRLGGILRIRDEEDGIYLDYLADYPRLSNQKIELGQNLIDLLKESSYGDVATVLIPLGAVLDEEEKSADWPSALEQRMTIESVNSGKDYLIDNAAALEKGKITKVVTWDDVNVPSILKAKAQAYLNLAKYESKTIQATAVDLSTAGFNVDDFRFLDRIRILSEPHGIDMIFPLTAMTIYLLEPEKNVYTLGSEVRSYTSAQKKASTALQETVEKMPAKISEVRERAVENATQILTQWASLGYSVHTENESFYMDAPNTEDAVYVLRINSGGIGFSKTGIDGPYVSAWTIDGHFNADFISTGTISAERIDIAYRTAVGEAIEENAQKWATLKTQSDSLVTEVGKKIGANEIISRINQSAEAIAINASKINLNGAVSMNDGFKVKTDGTFEGNAGKIGSMYVRTNYLYYAQPVALSLEQADINGLTSILTNAWTNQRYQRVYLGPLGFASLSGDSYLTTITDKAFITGSYAVSASDLAKFGEQYPVKMSVGINSVTNHSTLGTCWISSFYFYDVSNTLLATISKQESNIYYPIRFRAQTIVNGNFSVTGTKARTLESRDYGEISLYAYETATPFFGDIGSGKIGEDGTATVSIDPVFSESIDFGDIHVFLQEIGENPIFLMEVNPSFFKVKGVPGTKFSWELKARQKGYSSLRMSEPEAGPIEENQNLNLVQENQIREAEMDPYIFAEDMNEYLLDF